MFVFFFFLEIVSQLHVDSQKLLFNYNDLLMDSCSRGDTTSRSKQMPPSRSRVLACQALKRGENRAIPLQSSCPAV